MPDLTRRRALLAVTSGVAALAGCASESDRPMIDTPRGDRRIEYEARQVRNEDGAVLFANGDELPTVDNDGRNYARRSRRVIVTEDEVDALVFNSVPEAETLRSFAMATDFDSASLYLFSMAVEACYEVHLQSASVEWDELEADDLHPHADFCREYRPADVACGVDETHTVGFAIRLPVAAEESSGSGSGMSSSCRRPHRGEFFTANVTPANGGETE